MAHTPTIVAPSQGLSELATALGELQEEVEEGGSLAPLELRVTQLEGDFQEVQIDLCMSEFALEAAA